MWIKRVALSNFRNFSHFSAEFSPQVTLIYGENGSGKTSILEAIALFGLGRSFRGSKIKELTKIGENRRFQAAVTLNEGAFEHENQCLWVEDEGYPHRLRFRTDDGLISVGDIVNKVPLQLLCANSFQILEASSVYRRQLLDWGCFFLNPAFSKIWRHYSSILKQRNALLRANFATERQHKGLWEAWDRAFLGAAYAVETLRQAYWAIFEPMFIEIISQFLPGLCWELAYSPGWSIQDGLSDLLQGRFERDCVLGYTSVGPHRADLEIFVGGVPAKQVLSRGQIKLLLCAMLVTRARVLHQKTGRSCVFLIDDADAELDAGALDRLFEGLTGLQIQWVATSVRPEGPWTDKRVGTRLFLPTPKILSPVGG